MSPPSRSRVIDVLSKAYRRQLLLALARDQPQSELDVDPLSTPDGASPMAEGFDRVAIYHLHLPKLDQLGYVTWEQDTGRITRGPNWREVEPYLSMAESMLEESVEGSA